MQIFIENSNDFVSFESQTSISILNLLDFLKCTITQSGQCIIGECEFNINRTFFALYDVYPWYIQWVQWQQIYISITTLTQM